MNANNFSGLSFTDNEVKHVFRVAKFGNRPLSDKLLADQSELRRRAWVDRMANCLLNSQQVISPTEAVQKAHQLAYDHKQAADATDKLRYVWDVFTTPEIALDDEQTEGVLSALQIAGAVSMARHPLVANSARALDRAPELYQRAQSIACDALGRELQYIIDNE